MQVITIFQYCLSHFVCIHAHCSNNMFMPNTHVAILMKHQGLSAQSTHSYFPTQFVFERCHSGERNQPILQQRNFPCKNASCTSFGPIFEGKFGRAETKSLLYGETKFQAVHYMESDLCNKNSVSGKMFIIQRDSLYRVLTIQRVYCTFNSAVRGFVKT